MPSTGSPRTPTSWSAAPPSRPWRTRAAPPLAARAVTALSDPAWQVRAGAATALSAADSRRAVPVLAKALADRNADVRKAAVLALTRHTATTEDAQGARDRHR
ncbi:hypothetical protein SVIOM342S_03222 [Streptomyces violaceorubidus]